MPQILNNTGVKLWSKDDYSELWLSVFEELTGTAGKSNIRLIDEAIGNINASLDGYYFLYENNRLYICKDNENSTEKFPLQLVSSDGKIVSSVDGTTITIDENGVLHGTTVDNAFSLTSANPVQNKVVKKKFDDMDKEIAQNATDVESLETVISSHISDSNNPHHISKTQIGLANVEDKSSETIRNEITKDNVTTALGYTPYTPNEIDNKFSSVETNISWKESVGTFNDIATIYPNPSDGWTVNVNDTDYTYRYDGSEWIAISANSIPKATNNVDGLLSKEDHSSYDDAVSKAHAHDNKSVLGKLGESEEGTLIFNGSAIKTNTDFVANTKDEAQAAIDAGLVDNGATVYVRDDGENTSSVTQEQIVEIAKQQIELYMENDGSTIINNVIDSKIGNGTITIRQGNVEKDSFTTNQNSDTIINLDANTGLPSVSESDNGKYLKVDNGQWVVSEMPSISYKEETNESGGITAIIGDESLSDNILAFSDCSWKDIESICDSGKAKDAWNIGDEKAVTINGSDYKVVIVDFDHDNITNADKKAGITIGLKNCFSNTSSINSTDTNEDGWDGCLMRQWLDNTLYKMLPVDLQAVIKNVDKKTASGGNNGTIETSSDKLFLFSEIEVFGTLYSSYTGEGTHYSYFDSIEKVKKRKGEEGDFIHWWCRSPYTNDIKSFACIQSDGSHGIAEASVTFVDIGICFGFCI